ncbi:MAG: hypothetical protein Q9168_000985 [Polycauliona sp. 1 TL-2023]
MSSSRPSGFSNLRLGEVVREKVQDGLTGETKEMQYTQCKIVGNGSFGVVFQTKLSPTGEDAAIKRVLQDKRFKNRELQIMRIVRHPNIVELKAFYYSNGDRKEEVYLNLVLEFVPETVYRASRFFNKMKTTMPILEIKIYIYQLFRSLAYIHSQGICHRDIKPQNLLLDPNTGVLKLCDFGSAKILVENEPNVSYICSRYYRAPELIFGATNYTTKIDVWSTGCVMAELMLGQPLFPGESGIDQLVEIIKVLGTPTREQIRTMNPNYMEHKFPQIKPHPFNKVFRKASNDAIDLIAALLEYTPTQRLSAMDAMCHPFFDELRDPQCRFPDSRHPNGGSKEMPKLFDFSRHEDDEFDRRPPRRQYQEPVHVKVRKQLLAIAESPLKKIDEEVQEIATIVTDNYEDEEIRRHFLELALQLVVEQAFKIPFVAAVILAVNVKKPELANEVISKSSTALNEHFDVGAWREVKLLLRFLGCLQAILNDEGVFPVLEELFSRAVDLQTASLDDGLGLEIVKIILLTIPYVMASSASGLEALASALLEKTDIVASTPHPLEALVDPYPGTEDDDTSHQAQSMISLLQRQLQTEAAQSWELACIPRPWRPLPVEIGVEPLVPMRHSLPSIIVPSTLSPGARPQLPEMYFSVYADQDVETVPPTTNIASSILRDALVDTISMLDYNRNATAKFLIDLDCYFAPETFVKRATPFDRLREVDEGKSTWKPEDVAVDAVFSQLLQLPFPEHKLVYYHAVLTESCKIAPAAIAPSLGRAIRFLYRNVDAMDLELEYRFLDWFSHHLSNFGFTWKWTEWVDDVELPFAKPKKAFIVGALEKEIRLSFAQRIRGTLPEPYQALITEAKEKDTPDFKYSSDQTPYAPQAREVLRLLRAKAPDPEIQVQLSSIESAASELGIAEPLVPSTDAYMTAICFIGSKSLSHVLSCIERCKERLLALGPHSEAARRQIITSVMEYWSEKPGVGVNVVDKLLNYTILTPSSVIGWALTDNIGKGRILTFAHIYEIVASTMHKVTNRVRQIVIARNQAALPAEQKAMLDETLENERAQMKELFTTVEDSLMAVASGVVDEMAESRDQDTEGEALLRAWGEKWLRVFRRKLAVEEAWIEEMLTKEPAAEVSLDHPDGEAQEMAEANGLAEGEEEEKVNEDML